MYASFFDELEKIAAKQEDKPGWGGAAAATIGGGIAADTGRRGLLGTKRIYHGTADPAVLKSIKTRGLDPSFGGTGASRVSGYYVDQSKGHVHVTGAKPVARFYAGLDEPMKKKIKVIQDAPKPPTRSEVMGLLRKIFTKGHFGKGGVVKADIPYDQWQRFGIDLDSAPPGHKWVAAKTRESVPSKYIHGGKGRLLSTLSRHKELAKKLPSYIRNNPKRFAGGALLTGGGLYAGGRGVGGLYRNIKGRIDGD